MSDFEYMDMPEPTPAQQISRLERLIQSIKQDYRADLVRLRRAYHRYYQHNPRQIKDCIACCSLARFDFEVGPPNDAIIDEVLASLETDQ